MSVTGVVALVPVLRPVARAADDPFFCEDRGWACEPVLDATNSEWLAGAAAWAAGVPLQLLVIVAVAFVANRLLRAAIERTGRRMIASADRLGGFLPEDGERDLAVGRSAERAATIASVAHSIATAFVVVIAMGAILAVLGVSLTAMFASAGVVGVALGFGAQTLVRDVLAGWFIVVEDRYGVGDTIDAGAPAVGVVERVTLRSTRLRDVNGTVWHVANGEILRVGNQSQNWSRAVIDVMVAPTADVDRACELLGDAGRALAQEDEWSGRLTSSPNVFGVHLIDPLGITLRVVVDTVPGTQWAVEREYRRRALRTFEAEGIELATAAGLRPHPGGTGDPPPS